jgi:hypothetical protein
MAPSPDRAAGDNLVADAVPASSSHGKRGRGEATTASESRRVTNKVGQMTLPVWMTRCVEETEAQEEDTPEITPTTNVEGKGDVQETPVANTTENAVKLVSNLWSEDRSVVKKALKGLTDLFCNETHAFKAKNEREMRRLGGHMAVVHAVKNYVDDALIQEQGIRALCNLTAGPTLAQELVGDVGGVEVIVAGIKRHPEVARIQHLGCVAIGHLTFQTERNAERFEESDGIAAVIAAMKAHPENGDVQHESCYVLLRMCEWMEHGRLIIAAGGAATIACVMKECSHNYKVRRISHRVMQKLVDSD